MTFKFLKQPEFLSTGNKILFREGTARGIGTVGRIDYVGRDDAARTMIDQ